MPTPAAAVSSTPCPDLPLVRAIAARCEASMEQLYRRHYHGLYQFLRRVAADHTEVEDLINETMLTVWTDAERFRGESKVSTWIFGIAHRKALKQRDRWFRRRRRETLATPAPSEWYTPSSAQREIDARWLDAALADLPPEQRLAIQLAYVQGYSCEEIASIADCPTNTVKTRLFHARRKLRAQLRALEQ